MALEDVFEEIGGFNRFHVLLILFVYGLKSWCAWSMLIISFAGVIPTYYCTAHSNNTITWEANQSRYDTTTWGANQSRHDTINVCEINGTMCTEFLFQSSPRTAISEWSLVCSLKWVKSFIVSIQMAGVLVGAAVAGQTGDTYGRKNTIYCFFLLLMGMNIVSAFSVNWQMYCALRFFIGLSIGAILVATVPFCSEFLPPRWRVVVVIPMWSVGGGVFAGAAWVLRDWSHLHLATAAICLPSLFGYFYFPESVRWLAVKGRLDEAHVALEKMARMNRKTVPGYAKDVLQKIYNDEIEFKSKGNNYFYRDVFKTWEMAKTTCILSFHWITMTITYYGLTFAAPSLAGNLYLNIFIMNSIEIPANLSAIFLCNRFGRGHCCRSFMAIACVASFGCLAARTWAPTHQAPLIVTGLSLVANLGVGGSWGSSQVWIGEIYPTVIRSLAYGVMNTVARVGGIVSPYAVNLDDREVLSYVIMGSMSGLCVLLLMFVEETKDCLLPESLHQADVKTAAQSNGVHKELSGQLHLNMNDLSVLKDKPNETKKLEILSAPVSDYHLRKFPKFEDNSNHEKYQNVSLNSKKVLFSKNTEINYVSSGKINTSFSVDNVNSKDNTSSTCLNSKEKMNKLTGETMNQEIFIIATHL
ncbi:organic cation transporter protein-like [Physella acuta]|uniref:organic cation transporter protein-like n=1 Tax=Physella acuta TaxID=109671 RepID=UPI0027DBE202|nr:organic cation transporter protein-like [Physella acuta]